MNRPIQKMDIISWLHEHAAWLDVHLGYVAASRARAAAAEIEMARNAEETADRNRASAIAENTQLRAALERVCAVDKAAPGRRDCDIWAEMLAEAADALREIERNTSEEPIDNKVVQHHLHGSDTQCIFHPVTKKPRTFRLQGLSNGYHGMAEVKENGDPVQPWKWDDTVSPFYVQRFDFDRLQRDYNRLKNICALHGLNTDLKIPVLKALILSKEFDNPETLLNSREWLTNAVQAKGAEVIGTGCGLGQADIDIILKGCKFNISLRPI
jgi:hypothetical protein